MRKDFLLILLGIILLVGCKKDNDPIVITSGPEVSEPYVMLNYDAANMDAPLIPAGTWEGAARFPASAFADLVDGELQKVWFYLKNLPASCELKIYNAPAGASAPDQLLYSADLSASMEASRWNDHELDNPVTITDHDIWVSLRLEHGGDTRSLGCDPGPAVDNGDRMWTASGGTWITLRQFDGTNINWNIRAVVLPNP